MTKSLALGSKAAEASTVARPFDPTTSILPVTKIVPRGGSIWKGLAFFAMLSKKSMSVIGLPSPCWVREGSLGRPTFFWSALGGSEVPGF
jgi:hypothetical protein